MSRKNGIATAALIGLSLVSSLALAPMTLGQSAQTLTAQTAAPTQPAKAPDAAQTLTAQPAAAHVPTTPYQTAQTLTRPQPVAATTPATVRESGKTLTAQPATAHAPTMHGPAAQTLTATTPATVRESATTLTAQPAAAHTPATPSYAAQTPTPSAQPAVAPKAPDYVEEKGFKAKIFDIKYRDPFGLLQVIRGLGSGFKGATLSVDPDFRTMTVRDFPENIATIEEAIKRLDTPIAPRPDIEFSVHVLIASNSAGGSEDYPADLGDVVKQLKSALKYKSYALMTSGIHRAKEGPGEVGNSGVAESNLFSSVPTPPNPIFYNYSLERISIDSGSGSPTVQVARFRFNMRVPLNLGTQVQYENVGFQSPVGLRQGEKVVVGSTTLGDKGLVVVVSAKLLK